MTSTVTRRWIFSCDENDTKLNNTTDGARQQPSDKVTDSYFSLEGCSAFQIDHKHKVLRHSSELLVKGK